MNIDIYSINMNPAGENGRLLRESKRHLTDGCLRSLRRNLPQETFTVRKRHYLAFRPTSSPADQIIYLDNLLKKAVSENAILLVFSSLTDISSNMQTAYKFLVRWAGHKKVVGLYLTSLSAFNPFTSYQDKLSSLYHAVGENEAAPRNIRFPKALMAEAVRLRTECRPPVSFSAIEEATGIGKSALNSAIGRAGQKDMRYQHGRKLTEEEISRFKAILEEENKKILDRIEVYPDKEDRDAEW